MTDTAPDGKRSKAWAFAACVLGAALVAIVGMLALEGWIRHVARQAGESAMAAYGGERWDSLVKQAECSDCPMRERNRAVWALGQMEERRALPALKKHYTGEKCDHQAELCQYELDKAIRKIEGTWGLQGTLNRMARPHYAR